MSGEGPTPDAAPPAEELAKLSVAADAAPADAAEPAAGEDQLSDRQRKKLEAKRLKEEKRKAREAARKAREGGNIPIVSFNSAELPQDMFGDLERVQSRGHTQRKWKRVSDLNASLAGETVWVRGRVHTVRGKGKLAFIVLRQSFSTVQVVAAVPEEDAEPTGVTKEMVKYIGKLPRESIVDICATVAPCEVASCSQGDVELQAQRVYCSSRALATPPFTVEDASRSEKEIEEARARGEEMNSVSQSIRLDNRTIDLRAPANVAIMRVVSGICQLWRETLSAHGFTEIHTPKIIGGSSEGGAEVFRLDYFGSKACLAQSPQLYKQMAVLADLERVFEIAPVFRAENAQTHRHLCEFIGLDMEMAFYDHYHEVLEVLEQLFLSIFQGLEERYANELKIISQQYPFEPLKYPKDGKVLRLTFAEAIALLKENGIEANPLEDIGTEHEKKIGELVRVKYDTDFYTIDKFPLAARPFYTMPDPNNQDYSNSYDIFIRGEEVCSGAQRIHDPEFLAARATEHGIDVETLQSYVDAFKYGSFPHAGGGVGLERVAMLFLGVHNVRRTSMFPRDPTRLFP